MKNLLLYFLTAYLISWLIWLPLYLPYLGITGLPILPFHHALGAFGPMAAAFLFSLKERGIEGIKDLSMRMFTPGSNWSYLAIAFLSPFVIILFTSLINSLFNSTATDFTGIGMSDEFPQFSFIGFFLYNLISFGYGEEVGWRGYALPLLQKKVNPFWASVILALGWAAWHIPLFFYRPGYLGMEIGDIFGWLMSLLTGSILLTWLFNKSERSLLVCAVFHATIDIAFTSNIPDKGIINIAGIVITVWGIATLILFRKYFFVKQ